MKHPSPATDPTLSPQLTVRTADDLACLLDRSQHYRTIRLNAPGVQEPQRLRWQDDLARHYSGCGCGSGNLFGLVGVAVAAAYLMIYVGTSSNSAAGPWLHGGVAFAVVAAFAAAGKWFGLRRAHRRLRKSIQSLASVLDAARIQAAAQAASS